MAGTASPTPAERLQQAVDLLRQDRLPEADAALQAVLKRWPGQPDALHFLGVLRHTQHRSGEGLQLIRQAVERMPRQPGPWNNLGNVLLACGQPEEAMRAYRRSIELGRGLPASADAWSNVAAMLRGQQDWTGAEAASREALAVRPDFVTAWYGLSLALMGQGRVAEGLQANSKAVTLSPHDRQPRNQVIRALMLLGEHDKAAQLYRDWLREDPGNPIAQHQLAACLGESTPARASDAYVEQVFDSFAGSFDQQLEKLGYRAPSLVTEALRRAVGEPGAALDICDAGCGTGLCGPLLRPWSRQLTGCDLSAGMLKQAAPRGCYDVLDKAELVQHLQEHPAAFDIVVSADTLCYFGPLEAAAAASHRALRAGGWLIFTVEALPDGTPGGHRLQGSGRYAHERGYLHASLTQAGFEAPRLEPETLRMEGGRPVAGWLVSARRAGGAAP